jgi:Ca-activated chloride channel family protein
VSFEHPVLAVAAMTVPVCIIAAEALANRFSRNAFAHANVEFLTGALKASPLLHQLATALGTAALSAVVLAAAGPHFGNASSGMQTIAICVDTSGSMNSRDVEPTRARAAAAAIRVFAASLPSSVRIAVVSFAGTARTQLAPTTDRDALWRALSALPPPNGQTAIGDALLHANALLPHDGARGVLVLTDGKNNRGTQPEQALRILHGAGVSAQVVLIQRGADLSGRMKRFAAGLPATGAGQDWSEPFAFGGLALFAAAWLTRERGAFRL